MQTVIYVDWVWWENSLRRARIYVAYTYPVLVAGMQNLYIFFLFRDMTDCEVLYYTSSNHQATSISLDMSPMLVNEIKTQLHWFFKNVYNYTVHLLSLII